MVVVIVEAYPPLGSRSHNEAYVRRSYSSGNYVSRKEYERIEGISREWAFHDGSQLLRLGHVDLRSIVHPNDRAARGMRYFVCEKGVVDGKIIHQPQGCGDDFGLYREQTVKTGQLPQQYSMIGLIWLLKCKEQQKSGTRWIDTGKQLISEKLQRLDRHKEATLFLASLALGSAKGSDHFSSIFIAGSAQGSDPFPSIFSAWIGTGMQPFL